MTRHLAGAICALWAFATPVQSLADPIVVELFTSQGCSSCPPADAILSEIAEREDVIALSMHVDYWDYIGWKDSLGAPEYTKRQKAYAHRAQRSSIYTPQMIIAGQTDVVGSDAMAVMDAMMAQKGVPSPVQLTVTRTGSDLLIDLSADAPLTHPAVVQVVRYLPNARVSIEHGENAGKTIDYTNVVTGWATIATWDGHAPVSLSAKLTGDDPVVVLIQEEGYRRMLAAARVR